MLKVQIPLERLIKVKEPPDTRLFYIIPSFLNGMIKSISTVLYRIVSGVKANPILSELKNQNHNIHSMPEFKFSRAPPHSLLLHTPCPSAETGK